MDPGYPKPITVWKGIPDAPQGAFVHREHGRRPGVAHAPGSFPWGPWPRCSGPLGSARRGDRVLPRRRMSLLH